MNVRNASLQHGKQPRNGGLRACYYSHSVIAPSEIPVFTRFVGYFVRPL